MSVTCFFSGRLGNCIYNVAQVIAHCKKYDLQYYFPQDAWACIDRKVPFTVVNTGEKPNNPTVYNEPQDNGHPYFHDIPYMNNVEFRGYYQSFKYFEQYREEILEAINFPWTKEDVVGIHVRLGDCIEQPNAFPLAPKEYYDNAIQYMIDRGYTKFRIFSDTLDMAVKQFISTFPDCTFTYEDGKTDIQDFISLSSCEHIITARSTFSLMASWFNRNPDKIVLCPTVEKMWWVGQNKDLLSDTENWLIQINF